MSGVVETTRSFLAVFPPADVVAHVARAVDALRRPGDGVGWVRPENVHYTLRFLGDLDGAGLAAAGRAGAKAAAENRPFQVTLGGPGMFPNDRRPRVLWLGATRGAHELVKLASALEAALTAEGLARDDKPFAPHLTLGRVRDAGDHSIPSRFAAGSFPADSFDVRELVLVKSTLDPRGARYEPLERFALR
jgi:2'-5' RNA ligase